MKEYEIYIVGNDIFRTILNVKGNNINEALIEANKILKALEGRTIEELRIRSIEEINL